MFVVFLFYIFSESVSLTEHGVATLYVSVFSSSLWAQWGPEANARPLPPAEPDSQWLFSDCSVYECIVSKFESGSKVMLRCCRRLAARRHDKMAFLLVNSLTFPWFWHQSYRPGKIILSVNWECINPWGTILPSPCWHKTRTSVYS